MAIPNETATCEFRATSGPLSTILSWLPSSKASSSLRRMSSNLTARSSSGEKQVRFGKRLYAAEQRRLEVLDVIDRARGRARDCLHHRQRVFDAVMQLTHRKVFCSSARFRS